MYRIFVIGFFLFLTSCGGGGDSGSSSSINQAENVVIEKMPGSNLIEMPHFIDSSDPDYLYLATNYSLVQIDKVTGKKRTIAGNMSEGDVFQWRGVLQSPFGLLLKGGYLYAANTNGRVMRVNTGADSYDAIEQFLPSLTGVSNFTWMTGNSTTLFYGGDEGIYAKEYDTLDPPTLLLPLKSWFNAVATDDALFVISGAKELLKFDLKTHQLTTIRSNLTLQVGSIKPAPMTLNGTKLYWMDGKSVYCMDVGTLQPHLIATINTNDTLPELVADDQYIYVKPTTLYNLYKITIETGTVTSLAIPQTACGLTIANGKLYFGIAYSGVQLYTMSDTGVVTKVFDSVGTDLGTATNVMDVDLISNNGKIYVKTGYKILVYDTSTNTYDIIFPLVYTSMMYAQGGKLYVGSSAWIQRVLAIPIDLKIREFDEIMPSVTFGSNNYQLVVSTVTDESHIYYISKVYNNSSIPYHRISSANLDGSNSQPLYETSEELRDLAIHNNKLFFTGNNIFGDSRWAMASIPLTGGVPSHVGKLLFDPRSFYKKGIFYIADTGDSATRRLYAVNVDTDSYVELIKDLSYDNQYTRDIFIDVSEKWLYVAQQHTVINSMPFRKLSRYRNYSWDKIGSEQVLVSPNIDVNALVITSISTDGRYLYYWHDSLRRVAE